MRPAAAVLAGVPVLLLASAAALVFTPTADPDLASHPDPSGSYADALARIDAVRRSEEDLDLCPEGHSIALLTGHRTDTAVVIFHGLTAVPEQFRLIADAYLAQGCNVWLPRLPQHGLTDKMTDALSTLTPRDLRDFVDRAIDNRALKQRLVAEGIAHAALVYDGDRAVAWAEYGTPEELPDIQHRKEYLATAQRLPDYRVTCILVERGFRGRGLAAIALRGAVEMIAEAGGGLVEGYPHDTDGVRKKNSSFLYNGTRTMYEREGFTYDRPKGLGNCVMVREVAPATRP